MRKSLIPLALFAFVGCRDRTSFAPTVNATPIPAFQFNGILATYNNPSTGNKETSTLGAISTATDRSKVEYPNSATKATLTCVDAGPGGVGSGRALRMDIHLPAQGTLDAGAATGCAIANPYAYVSLTHQLVPDGAPAMDISMYGAMAFWIKSATTFSLKITLSCGSSPRPMTTGDKGGYLDSAFTQKNACWYGTKSEMFAYLPPLVRDPFPIQGNGSWQKISIPMAAFSDHPHPGLVTPASPCGLGYVREISFTINRNTPLLAPDDYPNDDGTIYFDDLVFE